MKHTAQPVSFRIHRFSLFLLAALSVCVLLLTAACGTHPSQQTDVSASPVAAPSVAPASQQPGVMSSVVDVRDVNRALTSDEARDYAGDAVCAVCHREAASVHSRSSHAHTFRPVSFVQDAPRFRSSQTVTDKFLKYTYQTRVDGAKCLLVGQSKRGKGSITAAYALGTGHSGITYISEPEPGQWLEMRLSYYSQNHAWDFTPGQPEGKELPRAAGRPMAKAEMEQCLVCHSTVVRSTPESIDIARSFTNVGCERCHGPGRAHVDQATQALAHKAVNPARSNPARSNPAHLTYGMEDLHKAIPARITTICGACHRTETPEKPLSPMEEPRVARFQSVALARSACYRKSGTLSCLTCHDAHRNADTNPAHYDAVCLTCHSGEEEQKRRKGDEEKQGTGGVTSSLLPPPPSSLRVCPVNPRTGCTACHMPKTSNIIPHSTFSNHWIKVWPRK